MKRVRWSSRAARHRSSSFPRIGRVRSACGTTSRRAGFRPTAPRSVTGKAMRGEWYAFQVGVYASRQALDSVRATFTALRGPGTIAASAFTCVNVDGIDWRGRPFTRNVTRARRARSIPSGVASRFRSTRSPAATPEPLLLPRSRSSRCFRSSSRWFTRLQFHALTVLPDTISAHGDNDPWRLSRLRWLNSTLYQDDGLVPPYTPVTESPCRPDARRARPRRALRREPACPRRSGASTPRR